MGSVTRVVHANISEGLRGLLLLPPVNSSAEICLRIRGEDTATRTHTQAYRAMNIPGVNFLCVM